MRSQPISTCLWNCPEETVALHRRQLNSLPCPLQLPEAPPKSGIIPALSLAAVSHPDVAAAAEFRRFRASEDFEERLRPQTM